LVATLPQFENGVREGFTRAELGNSAILLLAVVVDLIGNLV
jgi:hypothetical protein